MMMIVALNSLVRQEEGAQREEEEEEKEVGGPRGTLTPEADDPTGSTRSVVSDVRNSRKHGRWCGVPLHRKCRG